VRLSTADTVLVTTAANLPPVVQLNGDRVVTVGSLALVDALATDPNADPLTEEWALLAKTSRGLRGRRSGT
jgi:hypothetical protein